MSLRLVLFASWRVPALTGSGAAPGGDVTATVFSPPGDLVVLAIALPGNPLVVPGFGCLWVDLSTILPIASTVQGPGAHWTVKVPVPLGAPLGFPVVLQGASGQGGDLKFTTPTVAIIG